MNEITVFIDDNLARLDYGLKSGIKINNVITKKPKIDDLISRICDLRINNAEELIDNTARMINQAINYDANNTNDYGINPDVTETFYKKDLGIIFFNDYSYYPGLCLSELIMNSKEGKCVHAGTVIRTILKTLLSSEYAVKKLMIDSSLGCHDVTLVYSSEGYVIADSKRHAGHEEGIFNEASTPVKFCYDYDKVTKKIIESGSNKETVSDVILGGNGSLGILDNYLRDLINLRKKNKQ